VQQNLINKTGFRDICGKSIQPKVERTQQLARKYEAKYIESKKNLLALGFLNGRRLVRGLASWMGAAT
jgi:hypothetical protein